MKPEEAQELIRNCGDLRTTYLGTQESTLGVEENVGVQDSDRTLHTMVTGPTGTGKPICCSRCSSRI
jgi:hypothetical protein